MSEDLFRRQARLTPFAVAETPLTDVLFSITRPKKPVGARLAPRPIRRPEMPPIAPPKGLHHATLRSQKLLYQVRGG